MAMTNSSKTTFCVEVAPLTSIPLTRSQVFTYTSDESIRSGALVSIPFARRTLQGVVTAAYPFEERPQALRRFTLKPIHTVLNPDYLTVEQIALAGFLSQEYFTSLGRCFVHFTPESARSRKHSAETLVDLAAQDVQLTKEQKAALKIINASENKPVYLFGPASSGKTEVYMRAIDAVLKKNQQALVLVPELTLLPQDQERYSRHFGKDAVAVLHSQLAPGVFFETWEKIRRGDVKVILGTRQALFVPFLKLGMVVVDEEQDDAYKQWDMSPRYDARSVAEELARLHGARLVFGSATPSIERYHKTETGEMFLATLPPLPWQPAYSIDVANMCFERSKKNRSLLSAQMVMEIGFALKYSHQVVLFINRQGNSAFSLCDQCKTVVRCPDCDRALVYDAHQGHYHCLHCRHKSSSFPTCVSCGGMEFKSFGIGTQKVEREILKQFPQARILRIDRQTMSRRGAQEKVYRDFSQGKADILIGTQMSTKGWDLPGVTLVGIIDADSLFAFPDFKTDEKAFQSIVQASGRMARIGSRMSGKAIVQTFHPENPAIASAQTRDFTTFSRQLKEQRQDLRYPPFGRLIKIVFQDADLKKAEKEATKAYRALTEVVETLPQGRVLPPFDPLVSKARGKYRKYIIIRLLPGPIPQELSSVLRRLAGTWSIDVDPINLV